jgi:signal transduction histidine kinase/ActR/RegA family two-component response regulator
VVRKSVKASGKSLFVISILVPVVLWGAVAWQDFETSTAHAREYVLTTTNALAEQTNEVLQSADLIIARMLDHVHGLDWKTIGESREVHDFLAKLKSDLPQVQSVFFVDPEGFNSASSRAFPMERFDNRQREYYREALDGTDRLYVAAAFLGQMTGQAGFTVSRPRITQGRFDGIAVVTLSPDYFRAFYKKISADPAAAALVRTDGSLLVRYPEPVYVVEKLPPTNGLLRAAASGADAGVFSTVSAHDGREKLSAFRRIDNQPLIATFGLARSAYLRQWYWHLAWMTVFASLTALAFTTASRSVLRQAEEEENSLRRLLKESERRQAAENKVHHLQKMEALGRLSGGVAHDFNNLLAAILGSLELALKRLDNPGQVRRFINTAMQAAERGAHLTGQMLAFSRNKDVVPQPIDVNQVIRACEDLLQRTVEAVTQISCDLDEGLWPAVADRVQLEVALLNLASNARDAMPFGGRLVLTTRNIVVSSEGQERLVPGDYVQISVADTGEGMDQEVQTRAFEPFFTTKATGKGTGLGLSQVYGFAEQLGGSVGIISTPGEGTTVMIWLPRAETPAEHVKPVMPTEPAEMLRRRVLLVDDDDAVRSLAEEMLVDLGHQVIAVRSGTLALERLRDGEAFDLLLTDYAMPVMTGVQLAAEVLRLQPGLPVLFVTGYADTDILKPWVARGHGMLSKPFSSADLSGAIQHTVARHDQGSLRNKDPSPGAGGGVGPRLCQ